MRTSARALAFLAVVIGATASVLAWQQRAAGRLRGEVARLHALADAKAALAAEQRRLVAAQPAAADLADLIARKSVAEELRSRLAILRQRETEAAARRPAPETAAPVPSLVGTTLAAPQWQNAGQATADAAVQSALWAAAVGDVDGLTELLAFDADGRRRATATFDRLPAAVQNEVGTPERLFALLTAVDVPLGSASILGQFPTPEGTRVSVQLADVGGNLKTSMFTLRADGERWRLQVPAAVVEKYSDWLGLPAPAGGGE